MTVQYQGLENYKLMFDDRKVELTQYQINEIIDYFAKEMKEGYEEEIKILTQENYELNEQNEGYQK